jgi:hypothetical protein
MCTVTFIPRRKGYCLGMNRDEKCTRAKGLPPELRNCEGRQVIYPSEPGGGTWIALNDKGVAFALINWYSVTAKAKANIVSRGAIIPSLSAADSLVLADTGLVGLPLDRINPFRLIGVFPACQRIMEWRWDSNRLIRKHHRWRVQQWISSGFDEPTAQRVRSKAFRQAQAQKSMGTIGWLRRLHRSHSPQRGPFSTCMHRDDAATVSYTELCLFGNRARICHTCSAPCFGGALHVGSRLDSERCKQGACPI